MDSARKTMRLHFSSHVDCITQHQVAWYSLHHNSCLDWPTVHTYANLQCSHTFVKSIQELLWNSHRLCRCAFSDACYCLFTWTLIVVDQITSQCKRDRAELTTISNEAENEVGDASTGKWTQCAVLATRSWQLSLLLLGHAVRLQSSCYR